ncbi:DUF937 domain-containing protein [Microbacterium sp. bgisy203]|uniref:DUF937 domain-containing protein n=1 Tax=Microbacterium sp. bgisy203 TaxID=3413799 RepID=UPI003D73473D
MAGLDDILRMLPIDQVAARLGVDPDTAQAAVTQGGGAILAGLQQNAATPEGSAAIEAALGKHSGPGAVVETERIDIAAVDTADGEKILGHVFGGNEQQVAATLTDNPQTAGIDFGKLLPMLAPIVMGMLAKNQSTAQTSGSSSTDASASGGGIGDIIGGLLGGSSGPGGSGGSAGGFDVGGLLGGLFGGGR